MKIKHILGLEEVNFLKVIEDLIFISAAALCISCGIILLYAFSVYGWQPYKEIISISTFTLMWASTVLGLLAGKYR